MTVSPTATKVSEDVAREIGRFWLLASGGASP